MSIFDAGCLGHAFPTLIVGVEGGKLLLLVDLFDAHLFIPSRDWKKAYSSSRLSATRHRSSFRFRVVHGPAH